MDSKDLEVEVGAVDGKTECYNSDGTDCELELQSESQTNSNPVTSVDPPLKPLPVEVELIEVNDLGANEAASVNMEAVDVSDEDIKPDIKLLDVEPEETEVSCSKFTDASNLNEMNDDGVTIKEEEPDPPSDIGSENDNCNDESEENYEVDDKQANAKRASTRPRKRISMKRKVLRRKKRKVQNQNIPPSGISFLEKVIKVEIKEEPDPEDEGHGSRNVQEEARKGPGRKRKSTLKKEKETGEDSDDDSEFNPEKKLLLNTEMLVFENIIYRLGDVIEVTGDDGFKYFGQIQRFARDLYCEKYVQIRWLIVKKDFICTTNGHGQVEFNPSGFTQGPMEKDLMNMRSIGFTMSRPSALCESVSDPVYNKFGEYAILFNSNFPEWTETSISQCQL